MKVTKEKLYTIQETIKSEGIDCHFIEPNSYPYIPCYKVLMDLCTRLSCSQIRSVILKGPAGTGKTSLVRYLANYFNDSLDENLKQFFILSVDIASMLSGSEYRGSFEKKVIRLLDYCQGFSNLIIFFDEAHCLSRTSFKDGIGIMDILKPRMIASNIRLILATTDVEAECLMGDQAFMRRVHMIPVSPLSIADKKSACMKHIVHLREQHDINDDIEGIATDVGLNKLINNEQDLHVIIDKIDFHLARRKINARF